MDLINQSFVDKKTGTIHTILNVMNGMALTDNIEKIPLPRLLDTSLYTPYQDISESVNEGYQVPIKAKDLDNIDPQDFFNNNNTYNIFADKIRNIDTSKIPEDGPTSVPLPNTNLPVDNSIQAVYASTAEDEMAEVARKYGATAPVNEIKNQNAAFAKYLDEDELPVIRVDADTHTVQNAPGAEPGYHAPLTPSYQAPVAENPVYAVFRQAKRNTPFTINLQHTDKLPRLDFIEMMEDSYETSIIDFLVQDYVHKILSDPGALQEQVRAQIVALLSDKFKQGEATPEVKTKTNKVVKKTTKKIVTNEVIGPVPTKKSAKKTTTKI